MKKNKGAMVGLAIVVILIFIALFSDVFLDYDTDVIGVNTAERLQPPSAKHIMGTDEYGRDISAAFCTAPNTRCPSALSPSSSPC